MGKEWIKLKETGQLYIEKILVTFDLPILFVCKDYENRKYLCLTIDDEVGEYVIAEVNIESLINMLLNKTSMESVFRKCKNERIIITEYSKEKKVIKTIIENSKDISGELLPAKDELFEIMNEEIKDYIYFLQRQTLKIYYENYCQNQNIVIKKTTLKMNNFYNENITNTKMYNSRFIFGKECSFNITKKNIIMIA